MISMPISGRGTTLLLVLLLVPGMATSQEPEPPTPRPVPLASDRYAPAVPHALPEESPPAVQPLAERPFVATPAAMQVMDPSPASADQQTRPRRSAESASDDGSLGGFGGGRSPFRYRGLWQPAAAVQGQATEMELWSHELSLSAPIWWSGPDMLLLSVGATTTQFASEAILPHSGRSFPEELWNLRAGSTYIHRFENGWTGGLSLNVSSASDEPFGAMRDVSFGTFAFLRVPVYERDAWSFALMYSPLSELPFPIPGLAYQWQPSDDFRMNVGLPLRLTYCPCEDVTLDFSYMLLRTVHAQASYRLGEWWQFYAAFDWESQRWFLHDRSDDQERLFSYNKRWTLGLQTTMWNHLQVDLYGGHLFDRFYFTGEDLSDDEHDRLDIESGLFIALQAGLKW
jgi:hypothetical protein